MPMQDSDPGTESEMLSPSAKQACSTPAPANGGDTGDCSLGSNLCLCEMEAAFRQQNSVLFGTTDLRGGFAM